MATQVTPASVQREHADDRPSQCTFRILQRAHACARRRTRDCETMGALVYSVGPIAASHWTRQHLLVQTIFDMSLRNREHVTKRPWGREVNEEQNQWMKPLRFNPSDSTVVCSQNA